MPYRFVRKSLSLAGFAALTAVLATPAFAHLGDHSHMSIAEFASHLLSRLDHALAIAAVAALLGIAGLSAVTRRKARSAAEHSQETAAT